MKFVKSQDLKVGMRLAKPIYNRLGVLLYDRESTLTAQAVTSVENFGLIGLYILEPAEPAPPLSMEEAEFERFQTIYMFRLREILEALREGKATRDIYTLSETILDEYGSLDHRFPFSQNLRSAEDYHYKHSLNVAILCAMIAHQLRMQHDSAIALVAAALLHDIGLLDLPKSIMEKSEADLTEQDVEVLTQHMRSSYQMLHPDSNLFDLPLETLSIIGQTSQNYYHPNHPVEHNVRWSISAKVLLVASEYDTMTAMQLNNPPISDIMAFRFLNDNPTYYDARVVKALTDSIHIVPRGCSVVLSNNQKAMVIEANSINFMEPVVLQFSDNRIIDLANPHDARGLRITDIMKTMDNRIEIDQDTLKQFTVDEHLSTELNKIRSRKAKLIGKGKEPANVIKKKPRLL